MRSVLWRSPAVGLLLLFGCGLTRAQDRPVELSEDVINISFMPPPGLSQWSKEQVEAFRKQGIPANFIFVSPQRDEIIMVVITEGGSTEKDFASFVQGVVDSNKERHKDILWLTRSKVRLGGRDWIRLNFKTGTSDSDMVFDQYVTEWVGQYVMFSFSSPVPKYDVYKAAIEKSAKTIQLSVSVVAPVQKVAPAKRPRIKRGP